MICELNPHAFVALLTELEAATKTASAVVWLQPLAEVQTLELPSPFLLELT
ncbi:hypothetical protein AVDCRST_MAG94-4800 [uncultured Leptolyngbya sp.]|uniref:Uncharacterized protein n=1 Tax=uncultured Leptolyngbya sp. TaxID=332963 RepID=A0A6J4NAJ1_9CYAN|nr:hypothetical protein AVDCRST_MAG94-4800 [uncultured Leptolyngbya sp.]